MLYNQEKMYQISKASILVMQYLQAFFIHFYFYFLITSLIQNATRFPKVFIDSDTRLIEQLYKQNT